MDMVKCKKIFVYGDGNQYCLNSADCKEVGERPLDLRGLPISGHVSGRRRRELTLWSNSVLVARRDRARPPGGSGPSLPHGGSLDQQKRSGADSDIVPSCLMT